jgi:hypothetical protein
MSLLTQKQIEEIQKIHDDIGECTFPHEECFIKELIEWNEKQTFQSEQEPFAWAYAQLEWDSYLEEFVGEDRVLNLSIDKPNASEEGVEDIQPLYTSPPKREPLGEGELNSLYYQATNQKLREQDTRLAFGFARAIEREHGIGIVE